MNLNQLLYFTEAARYLNLSRAAEALYISQPALSRQISKLEDTIGVQLFERGNRGLTLTPAGEILAQEADNIFRNEQILMHKLRNAGSHGHPPLRLAFTNDTILRKLNSFALEYSRRHPYQKFFVDRCNWNSLRNELNRGMLDLAFALRAGLADIPGVQFHTLFSAPNEIVMSRHHPLANRKSISLADLKDETFLITNPSLGLIFDEMTSLCAQYGFEPKFSCEHPILDTVLLEVAMGHGVSPVMHGLIPQASRANVISIPCVDLAPLDFVVAWNHVRETPHLLGVIDEVLAFPWLAEDEK